MNSTMFARRTAPALIIIIFFLPLPGYAVGFKKKGQPTKDYLAEYIERVKAVKASTPTHGKFLDSAEPVFGHGE